MEKQTTAPKKRNKGNFSARKRAATPTDNMYDKKASIQMKATAPDPSNKADRDLEKLVTKKGVFPSAPDHLKKATNPLRYKWGKSGSGKAS